MRAHALHVQVTPEGFTLFRRAAHHHHSSAWHEENELSEALEVAKALRASGGDAHRARALAISARDRLSLLVGKYGPAVTDSIAEISAWLAAG